MDQELDEFELLWPEYYADHEASSLPAAAAASVEISLQVQRQCPARSRPVDVPRAALVLRRSKEEDTEEEHKEEDDGGGRAGGNRKINIVVPPHLMLSVVRRPDHGETPAAWSASSSTLRSGRPRKRARDLRLLRNSVLRMTGFIEG